MCKYPVLLPFFFSMKITRSFIYLTLSFVALLMILPVSITAAEEEVHFFSYERFFLNEDLVSRIPSDGKLQTELNKFASDFRNGVYALSSGNLKAAQKNLLKAREIWPEYFGTDFLLALVYEQTGDNETAARYYKSYLNKLKSFHSGEYRISAPLIRSLTSYGIEEYGPARELVVERLAFYGINLNNVRPVITVPGFLLPFFLIVFFVTAYILVRYKLVPYLKKRERIKNPPEGFWVCPHCGADNPEAVKECEECWKPRPQSGVREKG